MSWLYPDRGALLPGRQNTGYQRRSSGKNGLLSSRDLSVYSMNAPWFIPGLISLTT